MKIGWQIPFATLVSSGSVLILLNGAIGSSGVPALTVAVIGGSVVALFLLGRFRAFEINLVDILFAAFAAVAIFSLIRIPPSPRDAALFLLALAAYPAGRLIPTDSKLGLFHRITGLVALLGTVATFFALGAQWNDPHGKPIVFGFAHAATVFTMSFGFLVLAVACYGDLRRIRLILAILVPPLVIFAASQVRFIFVALALALVAAFFVSPSDRRRPIAMILGAAIISVLIGLAVRPQTSGIFLNYIFSPARAGDTVPGRPPNPVAGECGELDNSVAIRKSLLKEAVKAVPGAGIFGGGLSSFERASCFKAYPHVTLLQTIIEFGFLGGTLVILLVAAALGGLIPADSPQVRFALTALVFVASLEMAHGGLTGAFLLFTFLGMAAAHRRVPA